MFFISMTDRILFWIDSDLTYFGLAYYLQKKIDAKFSGIIDITLGEVLISSVKYQLFYMEVLLV